MRYLTSGADFNDKIKDILPAGGGEGVMTIFGVNRGEMGLKRLSTEPDRFCRGPDSMQDARNKYINKLTQHSQDKCLDKNKSWLSNLSRQHKNY